MIEEQSFREFIVGYFKSFKEAATHDYSTVTVLIFAILASAAFGILRGLAYATGLYAVLHFFGQATGGLIGALQNLAGAVGSRAQDH